MAQLPTGGAHSRRGVMRGGVAVLLAAIGVARGHDLVAARRRNRKKGRGGNRSNANAFGSGGAGGAGGAGGDVVIPTG